MEIPLAHERFSDQKLSIRAASWLRGPQLLRDGNPVKGKRGKYTVQDNSARESAVELKYNFIDPIPKLRIDGESVEVARSLLWYEYLWMGLPILLIFVGGALGAIVGLTATYSSARIFRGERSVFAKYLLSGVTTIVAIIVFVVLAVLVEIAIEGIPT